MGDIVGLGGEIKKAYDEHGVEGLKDRCRRKPCIKNRVAPKVEEAVVKMDYEYPAYGQLRASNELRKAGILVSSGGVRSIWMTHGLETFKKRLALLEERAAKEGSIQRHSSRLLRPLNGSERRIQNRLKLNTLDISLGKTPSMLAT